MTTQHATLTAVRWSEFSLDQQVLMIGNEMNRGRKQVGAEDPSRLKNCYERVLRLVDLTIQVNAGYTLRRELLRWRDVIGKTHVVGRQGARRLEFEGPRGNLMPAAGGASTELPAEGNQGTFLRISLPTSLLAGSCAHGLFLAELTEGLTHIAAEELAIY